jgi:hypothetical protein
MALPLFASVSAFAGGPLLVGSGTIGTSGKQLTWNPAAMPIQYRVDGGPLSATINNSSALGRIRAMFDVWQNVPTAAISYKYAGPILSTAGFSDGNIDTLAEYNSVMDACSKGTQNPIVLDTDGSLAKQLGMDESVIAFAGICRVSADGYITAGFAFLNGIWQDGVSSSLNPEITSSMFDQAVAHEMGHFSGLDHSVLNDGWNHDSCSVDDIAGRPLMFPFLKNCPTRVESGLPFLATDDTAWISSLYPASQFAQQYGTISGYIVFSDGVTQTQGVNVIARQVDDPATPEKEASRYAVSVVSGYLFTGNPGQDVTAKYLPCSPASACPNGYYGNNSGGSRFGSRDPLLIGFYSIPVPAGTYTIEVENLDGTYVKGSSVGPLDPPMRNPGVPEFWNDDESALDSPQSATPITVAPGQNLRDINIILNGTPNRYDNFEDGGTAASRLLSPFRQFPGQHRLHRFGKELEG